MRRAAAVVLCVATACSSSSGASPADAASACLPSGPDARTACDPAAKTCDYFLHCGCGATDKCTAGDVGPVCAPAGPKPAGLTCGGDAECARGTVCVPLFGTNRCLQFCDDSHACPTTQACYILVDDRQQPPSPIGSVCASTCSLVNQDCSIESLGCYRSQKDCRPDEGVCLVAGAGGQDAKCERMSDCMKGFLCVDPGGPSGPICAKICDRRDGVPGCGSGTLCQHLPGQTETGVCLP